MIEADLAVVRTQIREIAALAAEDGTCGLVRPEVSGWSVGQHLEHLAIVLGNIAVAIRALLRGRGAPPGPAGEMARAVLDAGRIPRGVAQAPEGMRPSAGPAPDAVRAAVGKSAARWEGLYPEAGAIAACPLRAPHPLLGPLAAAEWVRFAAIHDAHHLGIVDEIRSVPPRG